MSLNPRQFLRIRLWTDKPPSLRRVLVVFGVVLACGAIYSVERWVGWPQELSSERPSKIKVQN
ncbi:hypothetical protein AB9F26_06985 [Falsihalocynthiibacter sp. BN13B15]|uniref:hypothetical protein n=1 Tax=Falsihalocynthiibacter sp. BN13B15 TaxID=3240871 RepID=UPI00351038A7